MSLQDPVVKVGNWSKYLHIKPRKCPGWCLFFTFLLAMVACTCAAQKTPLLAPDGMERLDDLNFDNLNTRDELPHQSVYGFTQDTTGFMWIATYGGLSRFDGYRLINYTHDPARPESLRDNNIRVLLPQSTVISG